MLIYLDTKDLINILEKSKPLSVERLQQFLKYGEHKIVLSFLTIMEISAPLLHKHAKTNVMALLNHIEILPHAYVHSDIARLELQEAIRAFSEGDNYNSILPFVNRFDDAVDLNASPATKMYINYPLSETVWDLYCFGALDGLDKYAEKLRQTFAADRALSPKPNIKANFSKTIGRMIEHNRLSRPKDISILADWIYSDALKCPSIRLGYELWHKMVRNITDIPRDSDLEDYGHIGYLPYVDLMTLDRRMSDYVCQVSKGLSIDYNKKIFRNADDLLNKLNWSKP